MTLTLEHREWLAIRREEPALDGLPACELLARGAELPDSLRYTRRAGKVVLLGERRVDLADTLPGDDSLEGMLRPQTEHTLPTAEQVEAVLNDGGFEWARREGYWAVLPSARLPREVSLRAEPGRVRVEAVLADWDEIDAVSGTALAEFLLRAQAALCFARCEISPTQARIVSQARADVLETDLLDSLRGVTAGCQRLAREVEALLRPAVARLYALSH